MNTKALCSRLGVFIANLVGTALALTVLVLSILQLKDHPHTGAVRLVPADCTDITWTSHSPFKFSACFGSICDPDFVQCPWPTKSSTFRIILTVLVSVSLIAFNVMLMMNRKVGCCSHRMVSYFIIVTSVLTSLMGFAAMCMDADKVRTSRNWCEGGLKGVQWSGTPPSRFRCDYNAFIVLCVLDAGLFLVFAFCTFVNIKYLRSDQFGKAASDVANDPFSGTKPMRVQDSLPRSSTYVAPQPQISQGPTPMVAARSSSTSNAGRPQQKNKNETLLNDGLDW